MAMNVNSHGVPSSKGPQGGAGPQGFNGVTPANPGTFDNLPEAIIAHIFTFLPIRDLKSSICVSKQWEQVGKNIIKAFNEDPRSIEDMIAQPTKEQKKCLKSLKNSHPNDIIQAIQTLRPKINKQSESAKINPILRNAASTNKIDNALLALIFGANVNEANLSGDTPLSLAAHDGHTDIVKVLIGAGADVNTADSLGATPLSSASLNGHTEIVKALLAVNADVNQADNFETTPLFGATSGGHTKIVKALLEAKADVNQISSIGTTPLFGAAFSGDPEIMEALLAAGANVNQVNSVGDTPLSVAALNGHTEIERMLENAASSGAASAEVQ